MKQNEIVNSGRETQVMTATPRLYYDGANFDCQPNSRVAFEIAGFVATPQLTKKYEQNQRQLLRASQQPRDRKYQHIGDCYLGAIDHT